MASAKTSLGLTEQKWLNMQAGVALLRGWLEDQLTYGLAAWEADPAAYLGRIAAQLTDAQLGGPAGALRGLGERVGQVDWAAGALDELGYWHLQCKLFQRADGPSAGGLSAGGLSAGGLSAEQVAGLALNFGHNVRKANLAEAGGRVRDRWTCAGVERGAEGALYYRRTYWFGAAEGHAGLQLDFNYGRELPPGQIEAGTSGEFEMLVYPDGLPGRLVLPEGVSVGAAEGPPFAYESWSAQREAQARVLAAQPWRREFLVAVQEVRARLAGDELLLVDRGGKAFGVPPATPKLPEGYFWNLLALAGGEPVTLFGVLRKRALTPLSVWADGRMHVT